MIETRVPCPCCRATGKVPLSRILQETLDAVPKARSASTDEVARHVEGPEVKQTAINNRLRLLEDFKLIKNTGKRGRLLYWRRLK